MRAINGQFNSKTRTFLGWVVVLALIIWVLSAVWEQGKQNTEAVNAHTCAVWGYQPDCRTPLK